MARPWDFDVFGYKSILQKTKSPLKLLAPEFRFDLSVRLRVIAEKQVPAKLKPIVVRSSWPNLQKYLRFRCGYIFQGPTRNLQELIGASVPTKRLSPNFDLRDLRSDQFSEQAIMMQWENVQMLVIPKVREDHANYPKIVLSGHSRWPICRFDLMTFLGHSRPYVVKCVFCL